MGFVNLSKMPDAPKTRVIRIENLKGGLNIHDVAWQIAPNQSPEMRNMWWENGALVSRPGLTTYNNGLFKEVAEDSEYDLPDLRCYGHPYRGWYVFCNPVRGVFTALSAGDKATWVDLKGPDGVDFSVMYTDGTFFVHNDVLLYKSAGGYYRITESGNWDETTQLPLLKAEDVEAYIPTTYINATPSQLCEGALIFGGGDFYQPYNRMSLSRRVLYNFTAESTHVVTPETAAVVTVEYLLADGSWKSIAAQAQESFADRTVLDFSGGALKTALEAAGTLGLTNNVRVLYTVADAGENKSQRDSIMGCKLAEVYGGSSGQGMCVVLSGYAGQPNAYFWSGNSDKAMDPGYFPADQYNLAGDFSDPITGFGKQQNMLVIFQSRQIGRTALSTTEVDGRTFLTMDYTVISPRLGCDLPKTIQLIENNLVFCNRKHGVMFIKDTSSAYENNVVPISRNIERPLTALSGLFYDLGLDDVEQVTTVDDSQRYWLFTNSHAWVWDYSLGGEVNNPKGLSWFYFDSIPTPACWFAYEDEDLPWYVGRDGYLRGFVTTTTDMISDQTGLWTARGEGFEKVLTLPSQDFATLEVLKNVSKVIFEMQDTGHSLIDVEYETDYESRKDPTPINTPGWSLVPRNLNFRNLLPFRVATVAIRRPRCLHVRHFQVRLRNATRGEGIAFVSAQIFYTLRGVDR